MLRRGFISLLGLRLAGQTVISNSQLPAKPVFKSVTTDDPDDPHPGGITFWESPGNPLVVELNAVTLSAPQVVTLGYALVFPSNPPAPGQTTIIWSQPDTNGVVTGTWQ